MGKREAILQATIDVVARQGIADAPTILIAKEAGAAELTLFRLFGNKNELLHQAFSEVSQRFQDKCWPEIADIMDIEQKLVALLKASINHFREKPNELSYFQQYLNSSEGLNRRPDFRYERGEDVSGAPLIAILAEGKAQGVFKALPMSGLVGLTGAAVIMFLRDEQIRKIKHSKNDIDLLIQGCLQGVKA